MPQSLVKNYIHIVFSTKYREALLFPPYEQELHTYIGGYCKDLGCPVLAVGGHVDHVHILLMLTQKLPLMTVVQKVKANSSRWYKTLSPELENFFWQDGYGAFSVNPKQVEVVQQYIFQQHLHHSHQSYQQEYRAFLKQYKVDFDERYLWD